MSSERDLPITREAPSPVDAARTTNRATRASDAGFARLRAAFDRAAGRTGCVRESWYRFAGRPVRMRVVGEELASAMEAPLAHLRAAAAPRPTLGIDLWDEACTGVEAPREARASLTASTWTMGAGCFVSSADHRFVGSTRPASEAWLDRRGRCLIGWATSAGELTLYERGKPLYLTLSVWYRDRGVQIVHAGLVADGERGLLIGGPGGAGKSTTTCACVCGGMEYLGDDYIGLTVEADGSFVGHSLYGSAWLEEEHARHFPLLARHAMQTPNAPHPKALVLLNEVVPSRLRTAAPIAALVLPSLAAGLAARTRRATKGQAYLRLVPSSVVELVPQPGADGLALLTRLVEAVPAYWLEMGRDIDHIPISIRSMLKELP